MMYLGSLFSSSAFTEGMSAQILRSSQEHASSTKVLFGEAMDASKQAGSHV
jgi:hypothetical protein